MAYVGNLTCRDCGLTFTARWGSTRGVDEYRCDNDHVVLADAVNGRLVQAPGHVPNGRTLADVFGRCPACSSELVAGRLPCCPVCAGHDHEVSVEGVLG